MRRRLAGGFVAVACLVAACGGGGKDPAVVIQVKTPAAGGPTATPTIDASIQIEPPELVVSADSLYQGGTVLISVVGDVISGQVDLFGGSHQLTQGDNSMYTFIGVPIDQEPGPYTADVQFQLLNGTTGSLPTDITVIQTDWTVDALTFEEGKQQFLDAQVTADEDAQLREVFSTRTATKFWQWPWVLPYDGPITSRFGEQRSIDGGPPEGHHPGTDIGGTEGDPVVATNYGVVVLARQMALRGNYVVIDHGGGVLSGYGHLSQFAVAEGQHVEPGQVIGRVGNTGLSTGAHLHWEISVDGVFVDALRWIDGSNGF
jgi:murein DD-endopeptidase MepM/ murein hydrolase activator NlpD